MLNNIAASLWSRLVILGEEAGQTLVEYSLIIAFVAIVCIAGLTVLGVGINGELEKIVTEL